MNSHTQAILKNLEQARRLSFDNFENIILEPGAVEILVHLFLHPGCKADVNLAKFLTGQPVLLLDISSHIITAFPSSIAAYAAERGLTRISAVNMLECFALDHVDAVEENQSHLLFGPSYALAHVLTIGTIKSLRSIDQRQLAEVEVIVCNQTVTFSHVLVPGAVQVRLGQTVFHHFGVIIASADTKPLQLLARQLQQQQDQKAFMQRTIKQVLGDKVATIDYAKETFFNVDMTGQIIDETKKDVDFHRLWREDDLQKIKMSREGVMFSS